MDFGGAIAALKAGKKVARKGWNGKGMFLWLKPGTEIKSEWCKDPELKRLADDNGGTITGSDATRGVGGFVGTAVGTGNTAHASVTVDRSVNNGAFGAIIVAKSPKNVLNRHSFCPKIIL